ncbi:MAG: hypothetical protein Kilf2KO_07610 [Rhodospirillales bacterium]
MTETGETTDVLTTFYNGSCPVCRTEIEHYQRRAQRLGVATLAWSDIMADPKRLAALGLTLEQAEARLISVDESGRLLVGIEAFAELWRRLPGYGWAAWLITRPGIKGLATLVYDRVLAPLIAGWSRRRRKRAAAKDTVASSSVSLELSSNIRCSDRLTSEAAARALPSQAVRVTPMPASCSVAPKPQPPGAGGKAFPGKSAEPSTSDRQS